MNNLSPDLWSSLREDLTVNVHQHVSMTPLVNGKYFRREGVGSRILLSLMTIGVNGISGKFSSSNDWHRWQNTASVVDIGSSFTAGVSAISAHIGKDVTFLRCWHRCSGFPPVANIYSRIFAKHSLHDNGIIWGGAKMIPEKNLKPKTLHWPFNSIFLCDAHT